MAYARAGSTAGANPPVMFTQPVSFGGGSTFGSTIGSTLLGGKWWSYISTHVQATVGTSDFIGDGSNIGIKQNDMFVVTAINTSVSVHRVTAVGSTFTSLSAGLMVSSAS